MRLNLFLHVLLILTSAMSTAHALEARLVLQASHHDYLNSITFSPDGQQLITGGADKTAILWDVKSGRTIRRFAHGDLIIDIAFSKDGREMLTAGRGLVVWNPATGAEIRRFAIAGDVTHAEFSRDGSQVLAVNSGRIAIWDIGTGTVGHALHAHAGELCDAAVSDDGQQLAFVDDDSGQLQLWDVAKDQEIRAFEGPTQRYLSLRFSPNGRWVLGGTESGLVRLFDIGSGAEIRRFEGPKYWVNSVRFSPDGKIAVAGTSEGKVYAWAVETGRLLWSIDGLAHTTVGVAVDPLGSRVGVTSYLQVQTLDLKAGRSTQFFGSRAKAITSAAFRPGDLQLITAGLDVQPALWDLTNGAVVKRFVGHTLGVLEGVTSLAFSGDGKLLLTGGGDNTARLWDVARGMEIRKFEGHRDAVTSVAISPDQKQVLTGSDDRTARLWNTENGSLIREFVGNAGLITAVAFSNDAQELFTGGSDATVRLWSASTGALMRDYAGLSRSQPVTFEEKIDEQHNLVRSYERRLGEVRSLAVSPDGKRLIAGGGNGLALLWDTQTGEVQQRLLCGSAVTSVHFSADGRWVYTGSADNLVRIWDPSTGREVRRFEGHVDTVNSAITTSNGKWLLTGSRDGTAAIWSVATGKRVATLTASAEGGWAVVSQDGRFDTSELEGSAPLSWVVDDEPFRPLPPETLMREYYQPKLLSKLMSERGEPRSRVRDISKLYREQPTVKFVSMTRGGTADEVFVDVSVSMRSNLNPAPETCPTHVAYDLRLFRNGQLVGQWPPLRNSPGGPDNLAAWRRSRRIPAQPSAAAIIHRFPVHLASADRGQPVTFTAYAFNEDRVRSTSVTDRSYKVPDDIVTRPRRAFIVAIGVNNYHDKRRNLQFAVSDAEVLTEALAHIQEHQVIAVRLLSDTPQAGKTMADQASRANIQSALALLAGKVNPALPRATLQRAGVDASTVARLDKATPDDVVIITYSGHGYTDPSGSFYLMPSGSWKGEPITANTLSGFISSAQLGEWLRDVDAGEIAMIIDACHSGASVDAPGFRPGPMGDRGLGQLAYDKGMRILAATQADDVAVEINDLKQGLLTYALVEDGLTASSSGKVPAASGADGAVSLGAWLQYAQQRTPAIYDAVRQHTLKIVSRDSTVDPEFAERFQRGSQTPELFDFQKFKERVFIR